MIPEIRIARSRHVHEMAGIERKCFPCPWSESQLERCVSISPVSRSWIAVSAGEIIGYACALISDLGLLHIANLAVIPRCRNQGTGSLLMEVAQSWGARLGAGASYLEVRKENSLAVSLYRKIGYWVQTGLPDYYGPGEDGLRCVRELGEFGSSARLARVLNDSLPEIPGTGVILGSGLSWLAELYGESSSIDYEALPDYETDSVPGHPGRISTSSCGRFVFLQGRRHRYQGYDADEITALPGALSDLGTHTWILTTSSGAVNSSFATGDAMIFEDHINLSGCVPSDRSAFTGEGIYSASLRRIAVEAGESVNSPARTGTFASVSGPAYETPAEVNMLVTSGVSAVSMSTAQEALLLSGRGCRVLGLSLITNTAESETAVTHNEVLSAQAVIKERQEAFLRHMLEGVAAYDIR